MIYRVYSIPKKDVLERISRYLEYNNEVALYVGWNGKVGVNKESSPRGDGKSYEFIELNIIISRDPIEFPQIETIGRERNSKTITFIPELNNPLIVFNSSHTKEEMTQTIKNLFSLASSYLKNTYGYRWMSNFQYVASIE